MLQLKILPAAVSSSGMKGWGGGWRVRNMLQLKVALQKILPAATSSSGMKGWGGGGWRVRNMLQLKVALQKILPAAVSSSGMKGWGGGEGKRHAATQGGLTKDPPSCNVKFWNEGVGGRGWRVRNMLQLKVALQKILPVAASSSGMKGWGGGGGG